MELTDEEIERVVRRYLGTLLRRYAPVIAGAVAFTLIVVLVPTVEPTPDTGVSTPQLDTTAGGVGSGQPSGRNGELDGSAAVGDGTTSSDAGSSGAQPSGTAPPNSPSGATATGEGAVAVSGVTCGPDVRQVTWSKYAPYCVGAFKGDNGGATAPGVTAETITISYRKSRSDQGASLSSSIGDAIPSDDQMIADMRTYIDFFNTQFELYGRKVVLKPFNGQGDPIAETQGHNPQGAQADAATAREMGAFGDMSSPLGAETQMYAEALAANKVLSFGTQFLSQAWYERQAPFAYAWQPVGDTAAIFTANLVCQRLANMPATFAGDPAFRNAKRVFGLLAPDTPDAQQGADLLEAKLRECGVRLAKRINYSFNLATMQSEATSSIAQMRAAGVTTVLCRCDPISPIFLTSSADQQGYRPEWVAQWWTDNLARNYSQDQWAHAITNGGTFPDIKKTEAYGAFKLAKPDGEPVEKSYVNLYWNLLTLYLGLHGAGPNLTPSTFQQGFFSSPPSAPDADFGPWTFGDRRFSPRHHFQIGWWNPAAKSMYDGETGAYQSCNSGAWYRFDDPASFAPSGSQLDCFKS